MTSSMAHPTPSTATITAPNTVRRRLRSGVSTLLGLGLALSLGSVLGSGVATPASAKEAAGLMSASPTATSVSISAHDHRRLPPGRTIRRYTVKPGDTSSALAVRFHAWTAELIRINHLGPQGRLVVGQRIKIPVVDAAVKDSPHKTKSKPQDKPQRSTPKRQKVRRVIARTARRQGVDPQLALAVAWQESGWQMGVTSSANAIGAMQVLRPTGRWMSLYAGRDLKLRRTRDNALAGVLLLKLLADETSNRRRQVAAYYQGLGAVREHGLFDETRPYVRNVLAIKRRLERGKAPA